MDQARAREIRLSRVAPSPAAPPVVAAARPARAVLPGLGYAAIWLFLLVFLVKTPLALVVLAATGAVAWARRRVRPESDAAFVLTLGWTTEA